MRIGFVGSRWLGVRCLEELMVQRDVEIVGVHVPPRTKQVWWTDVVEQDEVEAMGLPSVPAKEIRDLQPDLVFSVLADYIFKADDLAVSDIINLHPAPLPWYRGCNSYAHALMDGVPYYAATLHYIDEGIDTGPVIARDWLAIEDWDTGSSLYHRTQPIAFKLFASTLPRILAHLARGERVPHRAQDETRAAYFRRDSLDDKTVSDPHSPEGMRKIRALSFPPFEPAHCEGTHFVWDRAAGGPVEVAWPPPG